MTGTPGPEPPTPPDGASQAAGMRRVGALFGAVVAPTTFVTALLYYFGWHHAYWFFDYFGVNSTLLGFSTFDYLMRSLDGLFVPMIVTAAIGLLAFWGHDMLRARLAAGHRPALLRRAVPVLAGIGFLLALVGFWSVFARTFLTPYLGLPPISLVAGVILLSYAVHLRRVLGPRPRPHQGQDPAPDPEGDPGGQGDPGGSPPPTPALPHPLRAEWATVAEWGALFVILGLGLMWAANDYAASVGHGRAVSFAASLDSLPSTALYSERDLALHEPGVRQLRCDVGKSGYAYRYEGLVLVLQSAGQYVLVPRNWTPATGVALVLPRNDSVRLEFAPAPATGVLGRTSC
ncbi:hypothetical protein [Streptomyces sp. BH055]|uniref:hypothetical protein n=1 Tax=Streptomyces sp. BH055 TaxID=3401173 RepID=UPI003BB7716C